MPRDKFMFQEPTAPIVFRDLHADRLEVFAPVGDGVSLTRQEFAEECDVNAIVARFEKTGGGWPFVPNNHVPHYVDFTAVPSDLQSAMSILNESNEAFMRLPASVRKDFDNDPMRFVEYASDRSNLPRLRELGLAEPEKAKPEPIEVRLSTPPAPPDGAPKAS